jgi:hypothetical protein
LEPAVIFPAQQQLDEALTNAGHSDNCPAFEGHRCPGYPACGGNSVDDALYAAVGAEREAEQAKRPRLVAELKPPVVTPLATADGDIVTLAGPAAVAFVRYQAAARMLKELDAAHKTAQREYQEAHQVFADAVAATHDPKAVT